MAYLTRDLFALRSKSAVTLVDEKMAIASHTKMVPEMVTEMVPVETFMIPDQSQPSVDATVPIRIRKGMFSRIIRKKQYSPATSEIASFREAQRPVTAPRHTVHTESTDIFDGYNTRVEDLRKTEYPDLEDRAYLDNAGTQLPPKSLLESFAHDLSSRLYGNPHTHSLPARNSAATVAEVRARALEFFRADPEEFELVFVANATAAIKIVGESIKDYVNAHNATASRSKRLTMSYAYHKDAHNSLIGCREYASDAKHQCFANNAEVEEGLASPKVTKNNLTLFSYPGQSNMTGERLPTSWLQAAKNRPNTYTLFDAAALSTTSQLDLAAWAPDFTALSFYKIFGFPDLGALIVRKSAAHLLMRKKYFAGGTVDGVSVFGDEPMMVRRESIHEVLEEGTLPFHNIIALGNAMDVHARLFESMDHISRHTKALRRYCFEQLRTLRYAETGQKLCEIYSTHTLSDHRASKHGATIALNLYKVDGAKVPYRTVERAADAAGIFVRSGAMCNPGGMATHLGWNNQDLEKLFKAGMRCSKPIEIFDDKWTGVVRVSFGAASVKEDVDRLIAFLRNEYLDEREG